MSEINWDIPDDDFHTIEEIVDRALKMAARLHADRPDRTSLTMDLVACHGNGCPLRLADLQAADDGNFAHDVWGIRRYMDRTSGKLTGCFLPRFADLQGD